MDQLSSSNVSFIDRPSSAGSAPHGAQPPCGAARRRRSTMVKHYIKYAFSTLTAAMFASMV